MYPVLEFLGFKIYSYPLIMGMIWGISYHLALFLLEYKNQKLLKFKFYFIGLFLSSWLGAKVFYLLTTINTNLDQIYISDKFWLGGGFVFYGGLIFGIIFTFLFSKYTKQKISSFKFLIPILCLGHSLGRIGCLLAGCCYGKVTDFALSVHLHGHARHPVQLYEALLLFVLFLVSYRLYKQGSRVITFYLGSYSLVRFALEFLRGDKIRGENIVSFLSTSQTIALIIFLLTLAFWKLNRDA